MVLPQSMAIARYAAKEAGLMPDSNLAAAYCDALADTIKDIMVERQKIKYVYRNLHLILPKRSLFTRNNTHDHVIHLH